MTRFSRAARCVPILLCSLLLFSMMSGESFALSPSNSGLTGLWEYPTAQMAGDGMGWIGLTDTDPYQYAYVSLGYLPWLEANLKISRFQTGSIVSEPYGRYKDKSLDFKVLLRQQEGLSPSVAVGAMDMMGTELMKAYYSVATYQWDRVAVTMGYGTDRLNGFFGGVAWQAAPWLELKAEYSPLDYTGDRAGNLVHPDPADSKINFGAVATLPGGVNVSASYQRGEQTCFSVAYPFDLSRTFWGNSKKALAKRPESLPVPDWEATKLEDLGIMLVESADRELGLRDVSVSASATGRKLRVSYENVVFSSHARAMAGLAALVAYKAPWDVETVSFVACVRGEPVTRVDLPGEQLALLRLNDVVETDRAGALFYSSGFVDDLGSLPGETWRLLAGPGKTARNGRDVFAVTPAWEIRLDPLVYSDFYMDRWSIDASWRHRFTKGFESFLNVRFPIDNSIDVPWRPQTNEEIRIQTGVLSYGQRVKGDMWILGEAGWLDDFWFGGNLWGRWYLENSPFWVGFRGTVAHERDPESFASLADRHVFGGADYDGDEWWLAGWLQAGYHESDLNLDLTVEGGQFLDSDTGVRVAATRHWDDLSLGVWMTRTDELAPGRNYSKAGLSLQIPAEFWTEAPSDTVWREEMNILSAWKRYSARRPESWMSPEELWEPLRPVRLRNDLYKALTELTTLARGEEPQREGNLGSVLDSWP